MKRRREIEVEYEEPENWKTVYDRITEMRKLKPAPVDTMGCSAWKKKLTSPKEKRVSCLWSLMLSSQTKDEVTAYAMDRIAETGVSVPDILALSDDELDKRISKVGFHNKKVKYIKNAARILHDKYDDDIPPTLEEVLSLPGVGNKMAYLLMTHAWNQPLGIGVDVHVHRISNRLGWVKTETPEQTRVALESWLPKEHWGKEGVNKLLVGFGQTICTPVSPKCSTCTVNDLCPSAFKKPDKKKKIEEEIKEKKSVLAKKLTTIKKKGGKTIKKEITLLPEKTKKGGKTIQKRNYISAREN